MNTKFADLDREFTSRIEKDVPHYASKIMKGHFRSVIRKAEKHCDQAFLDGLKLAVKVGQEIKPDVALALYKTGTLSPEKDIDGSTLSELKSDHP